MMTEGDGQEAWASELGIAVLAIYCNFGGVRGLSHDEDGEEDSSEDAVVLTSSCLLPFARGDTTVTLP
jgi:hypothetical protein